MTSGVGSRGGRVIGQTRSGRPIYAADSATYQGPQAGQVHGYTAQDHLDAQRHHEGLAQDAGNMAFRHGGAPGFSPQHSDNTQRREHLDAAEMHSSLALRKAAGEGSRGGKVVAHTKSGRPIYARHSAPNGIVHALTAHPRAGSDAVMHSHRALGYAAQDHSDAADHHQTMAGKARQKYEVSQSPLHRQRMQEHQSVSIAHRQAAQFLGPWERLGIKQHA